MLCVRPKDPYSLLTMTKPIFKAVIDAARPRYMDSNKTAHRILQWFCDFVIKFRYGDHGRERNQFTLSIYRYISPRLAPFTPSLRFRLTHTVGPNTARRRKTYHGGLPSDWSQSGEPRDYFSYFLIHFCTVKQDFSRKVKVS